MSGLSPCSYRLCPVLSFQSDQCCVLPDTIPKGLVPLLMKAFSSSSVQFANSSSRKRDPAFAHKHPGPRLYQEPVLLPIS